MAIKLSWRDFAISPFLTASRMAQPCSLVWEHLVKRSPEPLESDLGDICSNLHLNNEKTWHVLRAQQNGDGSWNLEIKRKGMEAEHENNE